MITEDYVSFEIAKLLKEKGFNEYVEWAYRYFAENNICVIHINEKPASTLIENCYPYVTLQMAMKWLREVHNIAIETEWEHLWYAYIKPMTANPTEDDYYQCSSAKYEEAIEAAIKYYLENLILNNYRLQTSKTTQNGTNKDFRFNS